MKTTLPLISFLLAVCAAVAQTKIPSPEAQIKAAVMAAPADQREGATVFGYDESGEMVMLRKGNNKMICIADDPGQKGFSASCYHKDLEPFMSRGRQLKKQGKSDKEIFDLREAEAKSGRLKMPKQPSTLFVMTAPDDRYDSETGEVKEGNYRYVVYIPFATAESTGLPLRPEAPGMPWIMDPGTHKAHIMITPPSSSRN
jgi:hypothetical protein